MIRFIKRWWPTWLFALIVYIVIYWYEPSRYVCTTWQFWALIIGGAIQAAWGAK